MKSLTLALLCFAATSHAGTLDTVRGRAELKDATAKKAVLHLEARKADGPRGTRTTGNLRLTTKDGVLAARQIRSLAVTGNTAILQGPAVWTTKVNNKPVRVKGRVAVTVVDRNDPKDPSDTPDTFQAVFTPETGNGRTITAMVGKGDIRVHTRTTGT